MLRCSRCNRILEKDRFPKKTGNTSSHWCKDCHSSYHREWREQNKANRTAYAKSYWKRVRKNKELKELYGLSIEQYNSLVTKQNNKCAICGKSDDTLCVDHDHKTGKVRDLLCNSCNLALGYVQENFDTTLNLAKYIQKHKEVF